MNPLQEQQVLLQEQQVQQALIVQVPLTQETIKVWMLIIKPLQII
jgi:hypothetical protein